MANTHTLWISAHLAEKIRAHGVETYPNECCGALLGRDTEVLRNQADAERKIAAPREVLKLYPLANRNGESPRNRFMVTADDVRNADLEAQSHGLEVVGWYHSHPDHPARPSEYDREHAWPWYSYIIVNVNHGAAEDMASWRLNDDREEFSPEGIEIRQHAAVQIER